MHKCIRRVGPKRKRTFSNPAAVGIAESTSQPADSYFGRELYIQTGPMRLGLTCYLSYPEIDKIPDVDPDSEPELTITKCRSTRHKLHGNSVY